MHNVILELVINNLMFCIEKENDKNVANNLIGKRMNDETFDKNKKNSNY